MKTKIVMFSLLVALAYAGFVKLETAVSNGKSALSLSHQRALAGSTNLSTLTPETLTAPDLTKQISMLTWEALGACDAAYEHWAQHVMRKEDHRGMTQEGINSIMKDAKALCP